MEYFWWLIRNIIISCLEKCLKSIINTAESDSIISNNIQFSLQTFEAEIIIIELILEKSMNGLQFEKMRKTFGYSRKELSSHLSISDKTLQLKEENRNEQVPIRYLIAFEKLVGTAWFYKVAGDIDENSIPNSRKPSKKNNTSENLPKKIILQKTFNLRCMKN